MKLSALARLFSNWSIRAKLISTFLVITIFPLGFLTYLSNQASHDALTQAANSALFSLASQTADSIDNFITREAETIQIEAQFPPFQTYLQLPAETRANSEAEQQIQTYLANLAKLHVELETGDESFLLGFTLLDRTGTVVFDMHTLPGVPSSKGEIWADRSVYRQPILLGIPYSSQVEIPEQGELSRLNFAARVTNELNHPIGVLVVHYDGNVLQEIIAAKNGLAGPGSFGAVLDENLIYLAHGTRPDVIFSTVAQLDEALTTELQRTKRLPNVPVQNVISLSPELQQGLQNELPFFSAKDPLTGEVTNQVAVVRLNNHAWQVAFFQPENIFLEPTRVQTSNILLFSSVIALLSLGIAILAAQGLSTPLTRLTAVAEQAATGDLTAQAEVTSQDEIGVLAQTFNGMTTQLRQTLHELEQRVAERTNLLQVSREVGQAASASLNSAQLIHTVVNLITDRFGYYYAAIFLMDSSGGWAELIDATGEAGETLLARKHQLEIGGNSMVGTAIAMKMARIALDVGDEPIRFNNPLLPDTRSEIALPLIAGEEVIGALDVQSTQGTAFSEQDIETFQSMANQVAIAIQNARLYQQAQQQLNEISRLNQTLMREGWQTFFKKNPNPTFRYTNNEITTPDNLQLADAEQVVQEHGPIFRQEHRKATLTMPLIVRNQIIGMLNLKSSKQEWSQDDLSILNAVAQQSALALENARLVETSQQLAQREQQINQMTANIHHSSNMEAILKTTLLELATVLNVPNATIQLNAEKSDETLSPPPNF